MHLIWSEFASVDSDRIGGGIDPARRTLQVIWHILETRMMETKAAWPRNFMNNHESLPGPSAKVYTYMVQR